MKRFGILYSRSGPYTLISESCRLGVVQGITDVNANPACPVALTPVECDPQGNVDRYAPLCDEMLRQGGWRHVIGCVTSWNRKETIPVLKKTDATVWYVGSHEGFEVTEHVVYMHACPNQLMTKWDEGDDRSHLA